MHHVCAPKRLLAALMASVVAAMVVQAAATAAPRTRPSQELRQYRYDNGMSVTRMSGTQPLVVVYRYHEGMWIARKSAARQQAVRPDDRAGLRGIGA